MRLFLKILTATCVLSGVVIVGFVLGWFGARSSTPEPKAQQEQSGASTPEPVAAGTTTNADWEDKLEAIVGSEGEDSEKVKQLFGMYPQLPEDGQVEVAQ